MDSYKVINNLDGATVTIYLSFVLHVLVFIHLFNKMVDMKGLYF